jgi:nitrogen fixation protein FixH
MKLFPKIQNPWPVGLVVFFILFAGYIVGFVIFASRQDMDLVRADYYDQEIKFQQQIDKVRRTAPIMAGADVDYDGAAKVVTVRLPIVNTNDITGTVSFYRPSDAKMDQDVNLAPNARGCQSVSVRSLRAGLWRVRVEWKARGGDYYFEKPIVITGPAAS